MEQFQLVKQMADIFSRSFNMLSDTLRAREGEEKHSGSVPTLCESPDELGYGIWK